MSKMPWFRAYTEMVDDEKLRLLAFEDRWHFVALLCLKGQGLLDDGGALMMRKVAVKLGLDLRTLDEVARRLSEVGLIDKDTLQPIAWDARQMRSDSSSERVKAYRERQKQAKDGAKQLRNVSVTAQDTDTEEEAEIEPTATVSKAVGGTPAAPSATPGAPVDGDAEDERPQKAKTATRLPEGWVLPKAWGEWALSERADFTEADVRREAACFADHWHAKGGADARKVDWQATWRNWVRRAHGVPSGGTAARGGTVVNPHSPVETYAQRAARQRMEEIAPAAARKAPGAAGSFEAAQRFMAGGDVIDVDAKAAAPRIGTQGGQ